MMVWIMNDNDINENDNSNINNGICVMIIMKWK